LPAPAPTRAAVAPKLVCPAAPVTVPHAALPVALHVTSPLSVTPDGSASLIVTSSASERPPLVTMIVYVAVPPGTYVVLPSVLTTARLTASERVSLSLPDAVTPVGTSVAVAVLTSGSDARVGAKRTGTV
jgi:hypothetical protein